MTSGADSAVKVTGESKVVGVFGWPVAHSLSPPMHNAAFKALKMNWVYVPFPVSPENLEIALSSLGTMGIQGVNLTIPHKEQAFKLVDLLTEEAKLVGSVNTVHTTEQGLLGDSTDGRGFMAPLIEEGVSLKGESVVVLGAGGAARSIVFTLAQAGAKVMLYNRTSERAENLIGAVSDAGLKPVELLKSIDDVNEAVRSAKLLVHTTQVGMHPDVQSIPTLNLGSLHPDLYVYDLIYNPQETRLLSEGKRRGCKTLNGVKMLVNQGALSFQRWTGIAPPLATMELAVLAGLAKP